MRFLLCMPQSELETMQNLNYSPPPQLPNCEQHRVIGFTTPQNYATRLSTIIHHKGWTPLWCPTVIIEPTPQPIKHFLSSQSETPLNQFSALAFTSRTGISSFSQALSQTQGPPLSPTGDTFVISALGKDSELLDDSFLSKLCQNPDRIRVLIPPVAIPSMMVESLGEGTGRKILCPVPLVIGLEEPPVVPEFLEDLAGKGWVVVRVNAYETRWAGPNCVEEVVKWGDESRLDAIVFTSSGEVEGFLKGLKEMGLDWGRVRRRWPRLVVAAHGPVTAAGAERLGVGVDVVSTRFDSFDGVVDALASKCCIFCLCANIVQLPLATPIAIRVANIKMVINCNIPVIDLQDFPAQLSKLVQAGEEWGCFRLVNHHEILSVALMSEMKCVTQSLHDFSLETKCQNTGIIPGSGYITPSQANPLYEAFGLYTSCPEDVNVFCTQSNASPTQRETIFKYVKAVDELLVEISGKLADGMGVSGFTIEGWPCLFRLNKFNFAQETVGSSGFQIHTDSGFLTIVQDDCISGLEVMDKSGAFVPVDPWPGALVVNLGDVAKAWSNGRLRTVKHRVQCKEANLRYSIAAFLGPEETVEAPPELVDDAHPRLYAPFTFEDYRNLRFSTKLLDGEALNFLLIDPSKNG